MKTAVIIAGTNLTGGAGTQVDLETFMVYEAYGMGILAALAAQNITDVTSTMNVTPKFLKEQLDCVFTDIRLGAVKVGVVFQPELIAVIVEKLKQHAVERIVVDLVMVSTNGSRLLENTALELLQTRLLPPADIITLNLLEAEASSGTRICSYQHMRKAAAMIAQDYDGYILIKGGHSTSHADDLPVHKDEAHWSSSEKIDNSDIHGTDCTPSNAIAGNLALGYDMINIVEGTRAFISGVLHDGLDLGQGNGPLSHCRNTKQKQPL